MDAFEKELDTILSNTIFSGIELSGITGAPNEMVNYYIWIDYDIINNDTQQKYVL